MIGLAFIIVVSFMFLLVMTGEAFFKSLLSSNFIVRASKFILLKLNLRHHFIDEMLWKDVMNL